MRKIVDTNKYKGDKVHLEYFYESLEDFFENCSKIDEKAGGNRGEDLQSVSREKEKFKGLTNQQIDETKWGYANGITEMEKLGAGLEFVNGGSKFTYKWDEYDGDDMSMERYYEGMPSMRKRFRTAGDNTGRFVDIYVNIVENANVNYKKMLWKTYAVMKIIDELESMGIRTSLSLAMNSEDSGTYTHDGRMLSIETQYIEVKVKEYDDPANLGLFCSVMSPWFFRHWVFQHFASKYKARWGLGRARGLDKDGLLKDKFYIDTGECLSKESAEEKIKSVSEALNS